MSDRTSAEVFARVFERLAEDPIDERTKKLAHDLWEISSGYDFHPVQLDCDEVLVKLGLATPNSKDHDAAGFDVDYLPTRG